MSENLDKFDVEELICYIKETLLQNLAKYQLIRERGLDSGEDISEEEEVETDKIYSVIEKNCKCTSK